MSATAEHAVVWHDLECGRYRQDLALWLELAARHGGPVLDVGAGTGRVTLTLARAGHRVVALDIDADLLDELTRRGNGMAISTVAADARSFRLDQRFPLIIVPMQTLQLLDGSSGRSDFFRCAATHLAPGGVVVVAISDTDDFEEFEWRDGDPYPLPDVTEVDGEVFSSQPSAVRREGDAFVVERRRSIVDAGGALETVDDRIALDVLPFEQLSADVAAAGLKVLGRREIDPTTEHIGSQVVIAGV